MMSLMCPSMMMLIIMTSQGTHGCFPVQDVFKLSTLWSQDLRIPWRRLFSIGQESNNFMTVETQMPGRITKSHATCLERFSRHRYLVRVEEEGKSMEFRCIQFTPLTYQVVRRALTKLQPDRKQVNCEIDTYIEDDEVMIAYHTLTTEACPLVGGFQLHFHKSASIGAQCLDTLQVYNPRLEFACSSDHVLVDFGKECAPIVPIQSQGPYRQSFAYLQCVASWDVPEGESKAILLQKRNDPFSFWCMQYKPIKGSDRQLLNVHLSFRGKCPGHVFKNITHELQDEFSMFGSLAKFIPLSDKRCSDENYMGQCLSDQSKCFETSSCPSDCHRCNVKIAEQDCGFGHVTGHWTGVDSKRELVIDVNSQGFQLKEYGAFSCWDPTESKPQGDVHAVVRNDLHSSCLPFYFCAKLSSPSPGVLNFFMQSAEKDSQSGQPLSCSQFPDGPNLIIPQERTSMITLLNAKKLQEVPCNISKDMLFPSGLGRCLFSLKQCMDSCRVLHADYDPLSCKNYTNGMYDLEHNHVCHAHIQLRHGVEGIITSSVTNKRFLCWIFKGRHLYITESEKCNSEGVFNIVVDYEALNRFCPFKGIAKDFGTTYSFPGRGSGIHVNQFVIFFTVLLFCLFARII